MRTLARFIFPQRVARAVPFGRLSILVQLIAVVIFLGYILFNTGVRLPLVSNPYEVEVAFRDASGLDGDNRPAAAVAGLTMGRVTDVRLEDGQGIATLALDSEARDRIYGDATAEIRPINAINQLVVNVDPGTPSAGPLPDEAVIPAERTGTHVQFDRILEVFDADTRAFLQVVIAEAERALRGRSGELRTALGELGELTDPSARVADTLADRRRLLTRLVEDLDAIFAQLARRDDRLAEVVGAGSETLAVAGAREAELAGAVRLLPPTLASADRALGGARELARPLVPALDRLTAASEPLPGALRDLRGFLPEARALLGEVDALARDGRAPVRLLARVARDLEPTAAAAERPVRRLLPVVEELDLRKEGITQTTELVSGVFSTNDANGVRLRTLVLPPDFQPQNFGLPASAARSSGAGATRLERELAGALDAVCRDGAAAACALRLTTPGLPAVEQLEPVDAGAGVAPDGSSAGRPEAAQPSAAVVTGASKGFAP